jgi:hypothetical protein
LSDPGDQDLVRSRLCHAQCPSRKIGRAGTAEGSTGGAKFFKLPQSYGSLCDLPHILVFFSSHPRRLAASIQIGNIILKHFPAERQPGTGGPTKSGSIAVLHDVCLTNPRFGSTASQTMPNRRQIPPAGQYHPVLRCTVRIRFQRIPNLKACHVDFWAELHHWRDHEHGRDVLSGEECR